MFKRTTLTFLAFFMSAFAASAEIKIGIALPLTGSYAKLSEQLITGATFAAKEINDKGGIKGETIILETIDDKCDPKAATGVANQLVSKGVIAVIGHLCDRPSIEASFVYNDNKIVQLSPTSQNPAFTENRPLPTGGTYRLAARNEQHNNILTAFMAKRSENGTIAIVNDGSTYGKRLADEITEALKDKGITPVFTDSFKRGEERYRQLSASIVDSGATLVFIGSAHLDAATLIRDIDRLSKTITFIGGDGFVHADFGKLVLENNPNRQTLANIFTSFPVDPRSLPTAKAAVKRFQKAELNPAGLALRGYSAMNILASALSRAKASDFESLNNVLNKQSFKTPIGLITFNAKGDSNLVDYRIHKWQNKTIEPVN